MFDTYMYGLCVYNKLCCYRFYFILFEKISHSSSHHINLSPQMINQFKRRKSFPDPL